MRWLWLLIVLPSFCPASVVQIDDRVKKDKSWPEGTVLHETTGYVLNPQYLLASSQYRQEAIFRYRFTGTVKEGSKRYLSITVHNLLLESLVAANRLDQSNSKNAPVGRESLAQAKTVVLLVPIEEGRAIFSFPVRVVTESTKERVEVVETVMELVRNRLKVLEVAHKNRPAEELPWVPPREWPAETVTVYLDATRDAPGAPSP